MTSKQAVFAIALCALLAFDSAMADPPRDEGILGDAGDQAGDWKLDFKSGSGKFHNIEFVRLLRARNAQGEVKYDVIQMTTDPRYPFGLWDTYVGKCDSHVAADIWIGEIDAQGDAKGLPSEKVEFVPQSGGPDTLAKICKGVAMETVQDPIAYARDYLKR